MSSKVDREIQVSLSLILTKKLIVIIVFELVRLSHDLVLELNQCLSFMQAAHLSQIFLNIVNLV